MIAPHPARVGLLVLVLASALGCVTRERDQAAVARRAYDACTEEHGTGAVECEPARARLERTQESYEASSRVRWGCSPDPESPCPRER